MSQEFEYKIEYSTDEVTGQIVAVIPELNHVSSCGNSFAEAEAEVKEAALCYIETLIEERKPVPQPAFHTEGTYLKLFIPQFT